MDVVHHRARGAGDHVCAKTRMGQPSMNAIFIDNDFHVGPTERGSGMFLTSTREVSDFSAIEMDYPAQVTITQGESVSVKIEAEDNVLPGLQTRVSNDTLEIFYKVEDGKYVSPTEPVKITIVVTTLKEVDFNSAGELVLSDIESDELDVSVSGAGNLKLNEIA